MKKEKGFSLIELVVVMTIMILITTIGMVTFTASNQKARDGKRTADLEKIRLALEMARQVGTTYPVNLNVLATIKIMDTVPTDPRTATNKYYYERINGYQYNLYAIVENAGSTNYSAGTTCAVVTGVGVPCNYRISSP